MCGLPFGLDPPSYSLLANIDIGNPNLLLLWTFIEVCIFDSFSIEDVPSALYVSVSLIFFIVSGCMLIVPDL